MFFFVGVTIVEGKRCGGISSSSRTDAVGKEMWQGAGAQPRYLSRCMAVRLHVLVLPIHGVTTTPSRAMNNFCAFLLQSPIQVGTYRRYGKVGHHRAGTAITTLSCRSHVHRA